MTTYNQGTSFDPNFYNSQIAPNFSAPSGDGYMPFNIPNGSGIGGAGETTPPAPGMNLDWLNGNTMKTLGGLASAGGSLWGAYNGAQQLKQAKEQFKFSKGAFNANFANQAKMINTQLEDRQRARIGGTGDNNAAGSYDSLSSYMDKNKINGAAVN